MAEVEPIFLIEESRCQEMNQFPPTNNMVAAFSPLDRSENLGGTAANGLNSSSLKRKRPLKLEIPNVLREIPADAFKGSTAQEQSDGAVCFSDSGVGVFSLKGKKNFMEDAHKIVSCSNGNKVFFGVYDGHGGSKAAEFVADNLHLNIFEMLDKNSENEVKEEAVKAGYLKTDEEFLKQGWGSGACCVTVVIEGREMVISNLGDCRAVLCRDGTAEALTNDHRPARDDERRRIEEKGGYVEIHRGTWRVHGSLAVSRSIGDAHLKDWVVAEPDTRIVHLTPAMQYLVLASDGLWEEVGHQEAVDIVMQSCTEKTKKNTDSSSSSAYYPFTCASPLPNSARVAVVNTKRIFHRKGHKISCLQHKISEDEPSFCESGSPPSKSRKISQAKKMKIMNNENEKEKTGYGGVLGACKELVDLAVSRGSLDDITVMIIDLAHYRGCSLGC